MPVTTAHPALIYPLRKLKSFHYSALIIGSSLPDFIHFVPGSIVREDTHNVLNTILLDLPLALFVYLLFHLFLKRPLWDILPDWFQKRIPQSHLEGRFPRSSRWIPILISLTVGIWSHILLDSLTHSDSFGARYILPFLSIKLFTISTFKVYPATFLQYGISILGSLFMGFVLLRWLLDQKNTNNTSRKEYSLLLFTLALAVAGIYSLPKAFGEYPIEGSHFAKLFQSLRVAVFGGGETVVMGILMYAFFWNCFKRFRNDSPGWQAEQVVHHQ